MRITSITADGITVEFDRVGIAELEIVLRKGVGNADDGAESILIEALANTFLLAGRACEGVENYELKEFQRKRNQAAS